MVASLPVDIVYHKRMTRTHTFLGCDPADETIGDPESNQIMQIFICIERTGPDNKHEAIAERWRSSRCKWRASGEKPHHYQISFTVRAKFPPLFPSTPHSLHHSPPSPPNLSHHILPH